jgi:hypothetical protein
MDANWTPEATHAPSIWAWVAGGLVALAIAAAFVLALQGGADDGTLRAPTAVVEQAPVDVTGGDYVLHGRGTGVPVLVATDGGPGAGAAQRNGCVVKQGC